MIRYIFKQVEKRDGLPKTECIFTVDSENKKIEEILTDGGFGENHCKFNQIIGIEVLDG